MFILVNNYNIKPLVNNCTIEVYLPILSTCFVICYLLVITSYSEEKVLWKKGFFVKE